MTLQWTRVPFRHSTVNVQRGNRRRSRVRGRGPRGCRQRGCLLPPHATSLWYKIIDAHSNRASTALVTNIDFEAWDKYLGDPQLSMALLDRVVEGATIVKLTGRFYRVHRGDKH